MREKSIFIGHPWNENIIILLIITINIITIIVIIDNRISSNEYSMNSKTYKI